MTTSDIAFSPQLAPRPAVAPGSPERFTGEVLVGAVVEGPGEPWAVYRHLAPEAYALAAGVEGA